MDRDDDLMAVVMGAVFEPDDPDLHMMQTWTWGYVPSPGLLADRAPQPTTSYEDYRRAVQDQEARDRDKFLGRL